MATKNEKRPPQIDKAKVKTEKDERPAYEPPPGWVKPELPPGARQGTCRLIQAAIC